MSYVRQIEYTIIPEDSFGVLRNCAGCGCKTVFHSTGCFRVNANGNKIDVWLIYQCTKCRHTYNLTVRERCKPESIPKKEYEGYLNNSSELSLKYGTDRKFFAQNKAEVDWTNVKYTLKKEIDTGEENNQPLQKGSMITVNNSYALKIRTDRVVSELLNIRRSEVKQSESKGILIVEEEKQAHKITIRIEGDINHVNID